MSGRGEGGDPGDPSLPLDPWDPWGRSRGRCWFSMGTVLGADHSGDRWGLR